MPWLMVRGFGIVGPNVLGCLGEGHGHGFWPFLSLLMFLADKALLMALMKRWSPITQTFHLPMGEIGVPPIELFMMTGFSMGGTPPPSSEDFDPASVAHCIKTLARAILQGHQGCPSIVV